MSARERDERARTSARTRGPPDDHPETAGGEAGSPPRGPSNFPEGGIHEPKLPGRRLAAACTGVLAVAAIAAPGALAQRHGDGPAPAALDWSACDAAAPDGPQCATATVPKDWGRPRRGTIQLALSKVPATDQANKLGSLFVNFGGPGGDAAATVAAIGGDLFRGVNDRFDIIGMGSARRRRGETGDRLQIEPGDRGRLRAAVRDARHARHPRDGAAGHALHPQMPDAQQRDPAVRLDRQRRAQTSTTCASAVGDRRLDLPGLLVRHVPRRDLPEHVPEPRAGDGARRRARPATSTSTTRSPASTSRRPASSGRSAASCRPAPADQVELPRLRRQRSVGGARRADRESGGDADPGQQRRPGRRRGHRRGRHAGGLLEGPLARPRLRARESRAGQRRHGPARDRPALLRRSRTRTATTTRSPTATSRSARSSSATRTTSARSSRRASAPTTTTTTPSGTTATASWPGASTRSGPTAPSTARSATRPARRRRSSSARPTTRRRRTRRPSGSSEQLGNARLLTMRGDGRTAYGGNSACIDEAVDAYLEQLTLPATGTVCRQEVPFEQPAPEPEAAPQSSQTVAPQSLAQRSGTQQGGPAAAARAARAARQAAAGAVTG